MATKPLTSEAIALTEKKMDMALDDIIKMSKTNTSKSTRQRALNKGQRFGNGNQDRSFKVQQYMDSRPTLRQGVLAQKRTSFKRYNFRLPAEAAAQKAAFTPFRKNQHMHWTKRPGDVLRRQGNVSNGGRAFKKQQQPLQMQQEPREEITLGQRPKTLDSLFANMKEQRMRAFPRRIHDGPARAGSFTRVMNDGPPHGGAFTRMMNDGPSHAGAFTHTINDDQARAGRVTTQPRQPWLRGRFGSYRN